MKEVKRLGVYFQEINKLGDSIFKERRVNTSVEFYVLVVMMILFGAIYGLFLMA